MHIHRSIMHVHVCIFDTCDFPLNRLKESEAKLNLKVQELTRRENVLNMRLATKQEEMTNLLVLPVCIIYPYCMSCPFSLNIVVFLVSLEGGR